MVHGARLWLAGAAQKSKMNSGGGRSQCFQHRAFKSRHCYLGQEFRCATCKVQQKDWRSKVFCCVG